MKPLIFVPPAQAEALCDAQDAGRDDLCLPNLCRIDRTILLPWRGDESVSDLPGKPSHSPVPPASAPSAQLWPSSANSSR